MAGIEDVPIEVLRTHIFPLLDPRGVAALGGTAERYRGAAMDPSLQINQVRRLYGDIVVRELLRSGIPISDLLSFSPEQIRPALAFGLNPNVTMINLILELVGSPARLLKRERVPYRVVQPLKNDSSTFILPIRPELTVRIPSDKVPAMMVLIYLAPYVDQWSRVTIPDGDDIMALLQRIDSRRVTLRTGEYHGRFYAFIAMNLVDERLNWIYHEQFIEVISGILGMRLNNFIEAYGGLQVYRYVSSHIDQLERILGGILPLSTDTPEESYTRHLISMYRNADLSDLLLSVHRELMELHDILSVF